ncbi:UNVERIFIED_CONTAM: hypothetical protein K2H54_067025 [Gekko kuhli]
MGPGQIVLEMLLVLLGPPLGVYGTERRLPTPPDCATKPRDSLFCGIQVVPSVAMDARSDVILSVVCPVAVSPSAAHFLLQWKAECRFANGTRGEVVFLDRDIYDRQEIDHFDSRRGSYEAVTELGKPDVLAWNSQKDWMDNRRAQVDAFCRHNYAVMETGRMVGRAGLIPDAPKSTHPTYTHVEDIFKPTVTISPTKGDPLAHHILLICTAAGYYPQEVRIKWLKNGQEQTAGVGYAEELQNADWTYQYQVMLETLPQRGDIYTCQVEHRSLKEPITVQWEPQTSDSARSKVWTGVVGAVLGLVFVAVGLYLYLKNKKATPLPPPAALIG